jgi:hypothetical protein
MHTFDRSQAWKLNWYRQSELEGALLLGKIVKTTADAWVSHQLTKHCAEEANHSLLWSNVIRELNLPPIRMFRNYQSFFLRQGSHPSSLVEVLAFTQIFERRVYQTFIRELKDATTPEPAKKAYRQMVEDKKGHLSWVAEWLKGQSAAAELLLRYQEIDAVVFASLEPFRERLWDIEFLGSEI